VLTRYCSPYTQEDIILGCFFDKECAEKTKEDYIRHVEENGDPYKTQAYMTVDLKKDVNIEKIPEVVCAIEEDSKDAFILINHIDYMGQVHNQVMFIADDESKLSEVSKILPVEGDIPSEWVYTKLKINQLYHENNIIVLNV
jgi:hypothetical protein